MSKVEVFNPSTLGPVLFPYSQGAVANGFLYTAGQVALDQENVVVAPGDAYEQTLCSLERIEKVLAEKGLTLNDVVSTTVYISDLSHLPTFNKAWEEKFGSHRPARATVVAGLLIDGLVVEITAIAALQSA